MLTTLTLFSALALTPGQGEGLTASNVRATFGELGTERKDTRYLPGDVFFLAFDVEGMTVTESGTVRFGMEMVVLDAKGAPFFTGKPDERSDYMPLGGSKMPAHAFVVIQPDQAPGIYTCKVKVTDLAAKANGASKTVEKQFEVLPKDFGIVGVYFSADGEGRVPASQIGITGQRSYIQLAITGFKREAVKIRIAPEPKKADGPGDKTETPEPKKPAGKQPLERQTQQPNVTVEMTIYDQSEKPTLKKPLTKKVPDEIHGYVDEKEPLFGLTFHIPLHKEGGYLVELKATDNLTKKTSTVYLPLRVLPATTSK